VASPAFLIPGKMGKNSSALVLDVEARVVVAAVAGRDNMWSKVTAKGQWGLRGMVGVALILTNGMGPGNS
jgi:hypothetical protein